MRDARSPAYEEEKGQTITMAIEHVLRSHLDDEKAKNRVKKD